MNGGTISLQKKKSSMFFNKVRHYKFPDLLRVQCNFFSDSDIIK